ncbi:hypothetical protein CQA62_00260 [Helicobacter cholecystus]|uniref:ABC transporter domain-containing protein n=1 Tax=Helicobacter cholecystus TaxID=45498 RepID=A0A3D8IX97_9HELI|nr:ATP-binding cassette domain-containing protein [Helicobacter cholecystus]RDU69882.1 hypothetical protein CQA62_00260 [Helicobacter cholecystus]VEJ25732.1 DL-methionine transporter ATP-binding subunit [Helicobacter cholecystus]
MILYKLSNIVQRYHQKVVLDFKNLEIHEGEIIGISGKNGSGKSTLLRLLSFLEIPSEGEILYRGEKLSSSEEIAILLPEVYLLSRSVKANLEYMFKIRKKTPSSNKIYEVMELVGLDPKKFLQREHYELSSGERQRVGLAQRLLLEPKVLLLDEPTNSLDSAGTKAFSNAIKWAHTHFNTCVITISHDKKWLDANSNRRLKLHFGSLITQNDANLFSHNWSETYNGEKFYEFGNGEVLLLPNSKHLDRREGIIITQDHLLLEPKEGKSFEADIIGIRLEPKEGKELLLELKIGDEIVKKLIPLHRASEFKIFQKIRIGFDIEGILGVN